MFMVILVNEIIYIYEIKRWFVESYEIRFNIFKYISGIIWILLNCKVRSFNYWRSIFKIVKFLL